MCIISVQSSSSYIHKRGKKKPFTSRNVACGTTSKKVEVDFYTASVTLILSRETIQQCHMEVWALLDCNFKLKSAFSQMLAWRKRKQELQSCSYEVEAHKEDQSKYQTHIRESNKKKLTLSTRCTVARGAQVKSLVQG